MLNDNTVNLSDFNKGKHSALKVVFYEMYKPMWSLACKIVRMANKEIAEEIVLDAMQATFSRCHKFTSVENIIGYLFIAVRNRAINYNKSKEAAKNNHCYYDEEDTDIIIDNDDNFLLLELTFKEELIKQLYEYIESLPDTCKRIMWLLLEDKTPTEIALKLGIATQTVYAQKNIAIGKFKNLFNQNKQSKNERRSNH